MPTSWTLDSDRCFSPIPQTRALARELYGAVKDLPLICPHGHVPPALLANPDTRFGNPTELFIVPNHYVVRMLHSVGIPMEDLGVPTRDGSPFEEDPRIVWRRFCEHFHLFRATPTGLWIKAELIEVFGIHEKPSAANADDLYDQLDAKLQQKEFSPQALFQRFGIEILTTTDSATDSLDAHELLRQQGMPVVPTFRPDKLLDIDSAAWIEELGELENLTTRSIDSVNEFLEAIAQRRNYFRQCGAIATDHASLTPEIGSLGDIEAERIFARALAGDVSSEDAVRFNGKMLMEMARMSRDDGLTMQLHIGSYRNHNSRIHQRFGPDRGGDIPVAVDWTNGLRPLLEENGSDPSFRLILFTLDESTYSRELAPMAGLYPSLKLGAPWWFFDSALGMDRYLDRVTETAGIYNLAGFNDDTRAFPSIPTRHDVWRRVSCNWLANMAQRALVDEEDVLEMATWLAYTAAKRSYGISSVDRLGTSRAEDQAASLDA